MAMSRPFAVFGGINTDVIASTDEAPVAGASNPGTVTRRLGGVAFILTRTGGRSLATNIALVKNNARLAAEIAKALVER